MKSLIYRTLSYVNIHECYKLTNSYKQSVFGPPCIRKTPDWVHTIILLEELQAHGTNCEMPQFSLIVDDLGILLDDKLTIATMHSHCFFNYDSSANFGNLWPRSDKMLVHAYVNGQLQCTTVTINNQLLLRTQVRQNAGAWFIMADLSSTHQCCVNYSPSTNCLQDSCASA